MSREEILKKANQIVNGDRDEQYGTPESSFKKIASYWSEYLNCAIDAKDVAIMMILFKVARLCESNKGMHSDTWIDIAGYAACGGEVSTRKKDKNDRD